MKTLPWAHGVWALIAVGAFVLGSQRGAEQQAVAGQGEGRSATKSERAQTELQGGDGGTLRGSRAGRPGEGGEQVVLTDGEIEALGRRFREANNPIERRLAFSRLLEGLTAENALLMREQIAHLDSDSPEFREFHYAWGAVAGAPAVINGADTPKQDMAAALAGWTSADPAAALRWYEGLDLESDPSLAGLRGERNLDADAVRSHLLVGMIYGLSDNDPYAAADYVTRLAGEGNEKAGWMMGMIADKVLKADGPAGAATWAANLPEGSTRTSAVTKVAGTYAQEDPAGAAAWLGSISGSGDTSQGLRNTFSTWAGKDVVAAGEYLGDMTPSTDRDWAISGYAPRLVREDFPAAVDWANAIADPALQQQTLIQAAQQYYHRVDKEAAAAWLPTSGLSPEAQQQVINPKRR